MEEIEYFFWNFYRQENRKFVGEEIAIWRKSHSEIGESVVSVLLTTLDGAHKDRRRRRSQFPVQWNSITGESYRVVRCRTRTGSGVEAMRYDSSRHPDWYAASAQLLPTNEATWRPSSMKWKYHTRQMACMEWPSKKIVDDGGNGIDYRLSVCAPLLGWRPSVNTWRNICDLDPAWCPVAQGDSVNCLSVNTEFGRYTSRDHQRCDRPYPAESLLN